MTKIRQRKYLKAFLDFTSRHGICQIYSGNGAFIETVLTLYIIHCKLHNTLYICQIYSKNSAFIGTV